MDAMINLLGRQAQILMNDEIVLGMLAECTTEEEKLEKLAIASMWALIKANR